MLVGASLKCSVAFPSSSCRWRRLGFWWGCGLRHGGLCAPFLQKNEQVPQDSDSVGEDDYLWRFGMQSILQDVDQVDLEAYVPELGGGLDVAAPGGWRWWCVGLCCCLGGGWLGGRGFSGGECGRLG